MKYEELRKSKEYWTAKIQIDLYNKVEKYLKDKRITRSELARELGVSKGYVTQILNGDFDHRISKLVELALSIGYYPNIDFEPMNCDILDVENMMLKVRNLQFQLEKNSDYRIYIENKNSNITLLLGKSSQEGTSRLSA